MNLQITKSVVEHQFNRYVEEKLKEMGQTLNDTELEKQKNRLRENATADLYPGTDNF